MAQRWTPSIVAMAGTLPAARRHLIAGAAVDHPAAGGLHDLRRVVGIVVAAVPPPALTFGVHAINVAVLAGLAALGAFFDPADDRPRDDAARGGYTWAGWTLDHANSVYRGDLQLRRTSSDPA
jgi:hypothetical protein